MRAWKKERMGLLPGFQYSNGGAFRIWTVVGAEMGTGLREYVDQKKKTDTGRYHGMGVAVLAEKDKGMAGCMGQLRD